MSADKKRKLGRGLSGMMGTGSAGIGSGGGGLGGSPRSVKDRGEGLDEGGRAVSTGRGPSGGDIVSESSVTEAKPDVATITLSDVHGAAIGVQEVELSRIVVSPYQPRRGMDEAELQALAASIRQSGVIQPVLVRPKGEGYELVAGERRWRAAQLAGLERIPAFIRELDDVAAAEAALVENIQRVDLNPIERAHALKSLGELFGLTHEQVAGRVGLERPTVSNLIRLTELSPGIQELLGTWRLAMGHARALLGVGDLERREALAKQAAEEGWSVRKLEEAVKALAAPEAVKTPAGKARSAALEDLEKRLGEHLGTKVAVKPKGDGRKGTLVIEYYSLDHFDGLMGRLGFAGE